MRRDAGPTNCTPNDAHASIFSVLLVLYMQDTFTPFLNFKVMNIGWLESDLTQVETVIYKALCFDVAQGRMSGAPNETRTHSCRFASLACLPLHHQRCPTQVENDSHCHQLDEYMGE